MIFLGLFSNFVSRSFWSLRFGYSIKSFFPVWLVFFCVLFIFAFSSRQLYSYLNSIQMVPNWNLIFRDKSLFHQHVPNLSKGQCFLIEAGRRPGSSNNFCLPDRPVQRVDPLCSWASAFTKCQANILNYHESLTATISELCKPENNHAAAPGQGFLQLSKGKTLTERSAVPSKIFQVFLSFEMWL